MIETLIKDVSVLNALEEKSAGTVLAYYHLNKQVREHATALTPNASQKDYHGLERALVGYLVDYQTPFSGKAAGNNISQALEGALKYVDFLNENFRVSLERVGQLKIALMKAFIGKSKNAWMYIDTTNREYFRIAEAELNATRTALRLITQAQPL